MFVLVASDRVTCDAVEVSAPVDPAPDQDRVDCRGAMPSWLAISTVRGPA